MFEKEELKSQIEEINQKLKSMIDEYHQLKDNPKVEKYLELKKTIDILNTKKHYLRITHQQFMHEECNHPLWYFLRSKRNHLKNEIKWTCQCLECDAIEQKNNDFFENRVILDNIVRGHGKKSSYSYKTIATAYRECSELVNSPEQIAKTLIKKYNQK